MSTPEGMRVGKFFIAEDKQIYGELRIAGAETSIYLRDDLRFEPLSLNGGCITGTLHDFTKVTLIQCVILEGLGNGGWHDGETYYYAKFFPHFVLEGQQHIGATDKAIVEIHLVIDDASTLFYDFDAFGTLINAEAVPHIGQIATANHLKRSIPIGPEPRIAYFAGKRKIIEADTVLGRVRAQHNPGGFFSSPRGVQIDNVISINVEPGSPIAFDEAISTTLRLLHFLELIIGRPQNLQQLIVYVDNGERREPLKVHWSLCPSRDVADPLAERRSLGPADLLLDPIERSEEFTTVIREWLRMDEERRDARQQFHTSFAHRKYSVERLVEAANMFDILPQSATPSDVDLSEELLDAKMRSREIFLGLPKSYERDSVLSALGRLGKASLKHKTRHRASYVIDALGERLPDLVLVLDEAVDCRNHYVHGASSTIDYSKNFHLITFFTNTLEFVFAASELIEAGWDIQRFIAMPTSMTHPLGEYKVGYKRELEALKTVLT